jgi:hypothetical protein
MLMLVALSGLGCQNKTENPSDLPAVLAAPAASPAPETPAVTTTPPPYPRYFPQNYPDPDAMYTTHMDSFRATLYSFIFGHDPGMPSAKEIEESVFGYSDQH